MVHPGRDVLQPTVAGGRQDMMGFRVQISEMAFYVVVDPGTGAWLCFSGETGPCWSTGRFPPPDALFASPGEAANAVLEARHKNNWPATPCEVRAVRFTP